MIKIPSGSSLLLIAESTACAFILGISPRPLASLKVLSFLPPSTGVWTCPTDPAPSQPEHLLPPSPLSKLSLAMVGAIGLARSSPFAPEKAGSTLSSTCQTSACAALCCPLPQPCAPRKPSLPKTTRPQPQPRHRKHSFPTRNNTSLASLCCPPYRARFNPLHSADQRAEIGPIPSSFPSAFLLRSIRTRRHSTELDPSRDTRRKPPHAPGTETSRQDHSKRGKRQGHYNRGEIRTLRIAPIVVVGTLPALVPAQDHPSQGATPFPSPPTAFITAITMSNIPSTPVKVPSSAANYTPATLDPDLRSQINTVLLRDGHVAKCVLPLLYPSPPSTDYLCICIYPLVIESMAPSCQTHMHRHSVLPILHRLTTLTI